MEQEIFQPGQLLKSNDGKEYIIFRYYLKDGRKCEECMPFFRGKPLGGTVSEYKRTTADFHIVSECERQLIDDATEYRNKAANAFFEARRRLRKAEDREARIKRVSGLDEAVVSISDIIGGMEKGIDDVIRYTAKDYIKGETVKKDLDNIRKNLAQIRQITRPLAQNKLPEVQRIDSCFDDPF